MTTGTSAHRFTPEEQPHAVMPLGGIGTGNLAIGADGGLRQWQLHNIGNHLGEAPWSFFALRVSQIEPPLDRTRVLQSKSVVADRQPTPLVTDNVIPAWQRQLLQLRPGFDRVEMDAVYPIARLTYSDEHLPLLVEQQVLTPFVPIEVDANCLPAAMFEFTLTSLAGEELHGWLGGTLQNLVGADGVTNPVGVRHPGYGGNTNRLRRTGWTKLIAENLSLPLEDPRAGQLVLASDSAAAQAYLQWTDPEQYFAFLDSRAQRVAQPLTAAQRRADPAASGVQADSASRPSPAGSTWCGALTVPWVLQPGESCRLRFVLAWHFPNRYLNFDQFGLARPQWGASRFWLGNHYAALHADAEAVVDQVSSHWDEAVATTQAWCDTLTGSSLQPRTANRLATQPIGIRSPTCFVDGAGEFYGFEGVLGESTAMWAGRTGGSCPLNCTHVWNYEHALAHLFPGLERSMRRTEFEVMHAPDGSIPHRVVAPAYLPQLWQEDIDGPTEPALDGMLGSILKTYREVRNGAGSAFLERYWPSVQRLVDHISQRWDTAGDGMLHGVQPSTHDIDLCGINSFMGTLWLAALRAVEEMARLLGETSYATATRARFEQASLAYDTALWNGEYYQQILEPGESSDYQWLGGCLSDQLIGQWWAHELGLGHVLPAEHVRQALRSVVRHNLKHDFEGFEHPYRIYADSDDSGLLMCSWPHGERPAVPTRYADEVWSGSEYQVAAHCLREGLVDEATGILDALWTRHDGRRRNPFNEIECGDHYARALAGWSVLRALTGVDYDATTGTLTVAPVRALLTPIDDALVLPIVLGNAWGSLRVAPDRVEIELRAGSLDLRSLRVDDRTWELAVTVTPDTALRLAPRPGQQPSAATR